MNIQVVKFEDKYLNDALRIWNHVVLEGNAFPQDTTLGIENGREFFLSQTYTGIAVDTDTNKVVGLYILHPNNVGRCGHICNASYAVDYDLRGNHIGEALVTDCLSKGKGYGYRVLQFNAVVSTNATARHLYEKLGFIQLGTIKGGFRMPDGNYEDICPYYKELK